MMIVLSELCKTESSTSTDKTLGELQNADATVRLKQILKNDILIYILIQDTPKELITGIPEKIWEKHLEIEVTIQDLKTILGRSTILRAESDNTKELLQRVRTHLPFAKELEIQKSLFSHCQFFRFGDKNRYLLSSDPETEHDERCNTFLFKEFPNIIIGMFSNKELKEELLRLNQMLDELRFQIEINENGIPELIFENDPIMLAIRKDHIEELKNKSIELSQKQDQLAEDLTSNLSKLKRSVRALDSKNDEIFINLIETLEKDHAEVKELFLDRERVMNKIKTSSNYYFTEVEKIIGDFEETVFQKEDGLSKPKIYTENLQTSEFVRFEESPYRSTHDDYLSRIEQQKSILDSVPLQWCGCYYIVESTPKRAIKIFSDLVMGIGRFMGLWITGMTRDRFIQENKLLNTTGYQLGTDDKEGCIPPVLSNIAHLISEFLSTSVHSVIYMDCIDALIEYNDIDRVLKFFNNIKDSIIMNDSIMIFSIKESITQKYEPAKLLRNSIDLTHTEPVLEDLIEGIF